MVCLGNMCMATLRKGDNDIIIIIIIPLIILIITPIIIRIIIIPGDRSVITKEDETILKYKDLKTQIQRVWNVKVEPIPVIKGATGTTSKSLKQYLSNIPGEREVKELQKTGILVTAQILREVLM